MQGLGLEPAVLNDPAVQTGLAPFLVALVVGMALRALGGERVMGVALGLGFLAAYALLEGVPTFPPPASKQKVFYLAAFGLAAGLAIDLARRPAWLGQAAAVAYPLACALWFAWRRLGGTPDIAFLATLAGLWAGGAVFLVRLGRVGEGEGALDAGIVLVAAALGAAGVAMLGASITLALSSAAVAAAAGGLALWDYIAWGARGARRPFGAAALLGGGGALVALAGVMALYTPQVSKAALALVVLVPFADRAARHIALGSGALARLTGPVALGAVAAVPALAAVGLAYLTGGP